MTCDQCMFKTDLWGLEYCVLGMWHGADHQTPCNDWTEKGGELVPVVNQEVDNLI